jgi:hypothetical protein
MMPALALVAIGPRRRWLLPLPLPLFLLWPFVVLAIGGVRLADALRRRPGSTTGRHAGARAALHALCQLRGLRLDVCSSDDIRLLVWFL